MKNMHYRYDVAQELEHIGAMILRLEQIVQSDNIGRQTTVLMLPNYWRERIKAIPDVPPKLQPRVRMLLAQLDAIEAATPAHAQVRARDGLKGR